MNLLRAASTISLFTLASRITGLLRDIVVAATFGAGASLDAFNVAFRIPNLLRRLFGEGAFSQAFVPTLARLRAAEGDAETQRLIDAVATVLAGALVVTCLLGIAAAPVVVWLMASGLERYDEAVVMTRVMFPYIGFISLVSLSAGILNTWKRFAVPAATPVLLNLAMIAGVWLLAPWLERHGIQRIYALAGGVMAGGFLQLAVQVPALARIGRLPRIGVRLGSMKAAWAHPGVRLILRQMAPALLGVSVAQLSILINTQIASHQGVGAVSWLFYADRLMEFPTALLGVALGAVLIPQLSAAQGRGDPAGYSAMLDWGLRLALVLALPCAAALLVFPEALIATLFQRGEFDALAVAKTAAALRAYGVGLLGLIGVKILAPGFYARQDLRTPVTIAVIVLAITQAMNAVFVPFLGHAGLALSVALGAIINAVWLFIGLKRGGWYRPEPGWRRFAGCVLLATLLMGALLGYAAERIDWVGLADRELLRIGALAACLGAAALLYFGVLLGAGFRPRDFSRRA
ncbi:MAG TPA: murein biosynthesis integral membrane protein MurJ [Caldimonas sp.]|jgi:putative peptidoglycan lipid II flippase|nr:murein biosynthesis integral membrane protein MurJ [Caldimonas sp.]HEX2540628.1 murein biosynthesis integral membrane protein MurJ [Caldimonas sp.]